MRTSEIMHKPLKSTKLSYQQAHSYIIKYEEHRIEGLRDGRGRRKSVNWRSYVQKTGF